MSLGEQFQQPQLPFWVESDDADTPPKPTTPKQTESAWKKLDASARESLVRHNLSGPEHWSVDRAGGFKSQVSRAASGRRYDPTKAVSDLVRLTDIPDSDIVAAQGTSVTFGAGASNRGGHREIRSGNIAVGKGSALQRRAIVTHELAHTLQSTLTDTQADVELHKYILEKGTKKYINDKSLMATDRPELRQLESPSYISSGLPIYEGSAEGYRELYQGPRANYKPVYSNEYMTKNYGKYAGEAFDASKAFTQRTGKVVPDDKILEATRLAGVLAHDVETTSINPSTGERLLGRNREIDHDTVHRMMTHLLSEDPDNSHHRKEYETRRAAIEGQVIQGSLLPDVVPETNQFGSTPIRDWDLRLSPRGQALRDGQQTEMLPEETIEGRARNKRLLQDQRRANKPLPIDRVVYDDPRASKHRVRLQKHQLDRQRRERELQETQKSAPESGSRVSSGEIHPEVEQWLGKLVYQKKADYARSYASARQSGQPLPELPAGLKEEHAAKARASVDKIFNKHGIG